MMPRNKWLFLAVAWLTAGVYGLVLREATGSNAPPFPHFDKMAHGLLFFVQIWLLCKAYLHENKAIPSVALLIFALIYAVASEWAQATFTLTRQADVWDGVADMLGAMMALTIALKMENIRKNKNMT